MAIQERNTDASYEQRAVEEYFSTCFSGFSFGFADNDYYGISERVFWVVCQKS